MKIIITENQLEQIENYLVQKEKIDSDNIINSFNDEEHWKWFDYITELIKYADPKDFQKVLNNGLYVLNKHFKYNLKRVIVKDNDKIVAFLIFSYDNSVIDDIGDNKKYPVILCTAVHPDYRKRGLLKSMLNKSGVTRPFLVHTSIMSTPEVWGKVGCEAVKKLDNVNTISMCK